MEIHDIRFYTKDGKKVATIDKGEIPDEVISYNIYGIKYAQCPKCKNLLGSYYHPEIRKIQHCPYCGD